MSNVCVVYHRVSTVKQGQSGLGLEAQKNAVQEFMKQGQWVVLNEFVEVESGKKNDRPQLIKALLVCKKKKATLLISKLDRLSRSVSFISNLMESGVAFVATDMPYANRLTIHILASVAEHEREMISQRTKAALDAAKKRGQKLGFSLHNKETIVLPAVKKAVEVNIEKADKFAENILPIVHQIQKTGITTYQGIANILNTRGITSPRGGEWYPNSVRNLLRRNKFS